MDDLPVRRRPAEDTGQMTLDPNAARQMVSLSPHGGYLEINSPDAGGDEWSRWLGYLSALTRHKLTVLMAALCGVSVAFGVSLFQTPVYVTGTTLEFQSPASQQQPFEGISFLNTSDPYLLQTQAQLLRSGMLQDRVYTKMLQDRADAARPGKAQEGSISHPAPLGSVRRWLGLPSTAPGWEQAVAHAMGGLKVNPVKDSRIVKVTAESTVPQVAADYVNTLASEFIQQNLEERWSLYQSTGAWLRRAQEDLKAQLEESEKQLLAYATASGLVVTSKDDNIAEQQLIQVQAEVSKAQADRIAKESVYRTAMAQPAESLAEVLDQGAMAPYQAKLADLRRELAAANTSLTPAHPKVTRLEAQIEELESAKSRESRNILNRMRTEYESALRRERRLLADFTSQSKVLSNQDQKLIRYKMLQREVDTYRKLYETTLQRGKEASVASALRPVSARIIDSAHAPRAPYKPNLNRNLMVGLLGGSIVGVAFILLRERMDASIRVPGSISVYLNLRELGVIPSAQTDPDLLVLPGRKPAKSLAPARLLSSRTRAVPRSPIIGPVELATWNRKASLLAESFRTTVTSILSSDQHEHDRHVIMVTSPSPREGKSTVITNLAIALAEINQRVLLIDADMRRPRLHTIFNQANTWGLSDLLREKTPCAEYPAEALSRDTHVPRLYLVPSGPGSVNVPRLLYSARMAELLTRLRNDFDAVLIDTPPLLHVADARIVSRLVDAVVLVFRAGHTTRAAAAVAVTVCEADHVPVLGTVLNDWNPRTMGYGAYSSGYLPYCTESSSL
jgi:succinoglycan biosynthesis transport protein ExoP